MTRYLTKDDGFTQQKSAKILVELSLFAAGLPHVSLLALLNWACSQISPPFQSTNAADVALQVVSVLLRSHVDLRSGIYRHPNLTNLMVEFMRKDTASPQVVYDIMNSVWLWTFLPEAAQELQKMYDIIPLILDTARQTVKEKVVRVSILALRGLLVKAPNANIMLMVGNRVLQFCEVFSARKWSDEDIVEDLDFLKHELTQQIASLSTWDDYASEVKSGHLVWSPVHTSESFWKQNASKLNEKDHEVLRVLARLLSSSRDPIVLSVACYDLGQYVKWLNSGKRFVQDLGAKQQMMELITHKEPEVRYNALMAIQQYMSNSWEF
jgi:V-type H+-transporting ATPase subunit H